MKFFSAFLLATSALHAPAYAQETPENQSETSSESTMQRLATFSKLNPEEYSIRRIDDQGGIESLSWHHNLKAFPDGTPGFSIAIQAPLTENFETVSPALWDAARHTAVSTFSREDHAIVFEGLKASQSVVIHFTPTEALRYIDSSCEGLDLGIFGPPRLGKYLFLHVSCTREGGDLKVLITHPSDKTRVETPVGVTAQTLSPEETLITIEPGKDTPFQIVELKKGVRKSRVIDSFEVRHAPVDQRWNFAAALSTTFLSYREPQNSGLAVDELGLTGKFAAQYVLKPNLFMLDGNAWGTLVPIALSKQPSTIPATRFFGVTARGVYLLPESFHPLDARWNIALGWYVWSMLNSLPYGVSYLGGPQVFIGAKGDATNDTGWQAYFKYAPIGGTLSQFSFGNYEIALGGGYRFIKWDYPMMAIFDLARVSAKSSGREISLTTVNVGVQVPLPFKKLTVH
jgi:hypothetical protein